MTREEVRTFGADLFLFLGDQWMDRAAIL